MGVILYDSDTYRQEPSVRKPGPDEPSYLAQLSALPFGFDPWAYVALYAHYRACKNDKQRAVSPAAFIQEDGVPPHVLVRKLQQLVQQRSDSEAFLEMWREKVAGDDGVETATSGAQSIAISKEECTTIDAANGRSSRGASETVGLLDGEKEKSEIGSRVSLEPTARLAGAEKSDGASHDALESRPARAASNATTTSPTPSLASSVAAARSALMGLPTIPSHPALQGWKRDGIQIRGRARSGKSAARGGRSYAYTQTISSRNHYSSDPSLGPQPLVSDNAGLPSYGGEEAQYVAVLPRINAQGSAVFYDSHASSPLRSQTHDAISLNSQYADSDPDTKPGSSERNLSRASNSTPTRDSRCNVPLSNQGKSSTPGVPARPASEDDCASSVGGYIVEVPAQGKITSESSRAFVSHVGSDTNPDIPIANAALRNDHLSDRLFSSMASFQSNLETSRVPMGLPKALDLDFERLEHARRAGLSGTEHPAKPISPTEFDPLSPSAKEARENSKAVENATDTAAVADSNTVFGDLLGLDFAASQAIAPSPLQRAVPANLAVDGARPRREPDIPVMKGRRGDTSIQLSDSSEDLLGRVGALQNTLLRAQHSTSASTSPSLVSSPKIRKDHDHSFPDSIAELTRRLQDFDDRDIEAEADPQLTRSRVGNNNSSSSVLETVDHRDDAPLESLAELTRRLLQSDDEIIGVEAQPAGSRAVAEENDEFSLDFFRRALAKLDQSDEYHDSAVNDSPISPIRPYSAHVPGLVHPQPRAWQSFGAAESLENTLVERSTSPDQHHTGRDTPSLEEAMERFSKSMPAKTVRNAVRGEVSEAEAGLGEGKLEVDVDFGESDDDELPSLARSTEEAADLVRKDVIEAGGSEHGPIVERAEGVPIPESLQVEGQPTEGAHLALELPVEKPSTLPEAVGEANNFNQSSGSIMSATPATPSPAKNGGRSDDSSSPSSGQLSDKSPVSPASTASPVAPVSKKISRPPSPTASEWSKRSVSPGAIPDHDNDPDLPPPLPTTKVPSLKKDRDSWLNTAPPPIRWNGSLFNASKGGKASSSKPAKMVTQSGRTGPQRAWRSFSSPTGSDEQIDPGRTTLFRSGDGKGGGAEEAWAQTRSRRGMSNQPVPRSGYEPEITALATFEEDYPIPLPGGWREAPRRASRRQKNTDKDVGEAFDRLVAEQACAEYVESEKLVVDERVKQEEDLVDEWLAEP